MVKPEDMINGEIYYVETLYKRVIRFKKILNDRIIGYTSLTFHNKDYHVNYRKAIDSHNIIRLATLEERDILINEEIKNGFFWADNVPREIIQIY